MSPRAISPWLLVSVLACVPAGKETEPPRGAAGFITVPSAAARRLPFTTIDGWTVQIQTLAIMAEIKASPEFVGSDGPYGGNQSVLFDGTKPDEIYARELDLARYTVSATLQGVYFDVHDPESNFANDGVPIEVESRFLRAADGPQAVHSYDGPVVVLVAEGKKEARSVTIDVALAAPTTSFLADVAVDVQANALTAGRLAIVAEGLFSNDGTNPAFDDIANADVDHDGHASVSELAAAPPSCSPCQGTASTLLEAIALRANQMLVIQ